MIEPIFKNLPAIIVATGPSLTDQLAAIRDSSAKKFCINCTYQDIEPDVFTACDPNWWMEYGRDFKKRCPNVLAYHYDVEIARGFGLTHIEGRWGEGLSLDPNYIHYNHSSVGQILNIAVLMGCDPIYLCGFDMRYDPTKPRHYFKGLSDTDGEYPEVLRKDSPFEGRDGKGGLIACFQKIAEQPGLPRIINCTKDSAFTGFEFGELPLSSTVERSTDNREVGGSSPPVATK